ncbi:MAG: ACP S-malonyltransferase, partial [Myxococcales bacterium]|nr:ACP S-malonyltransferase [Myxococcales bacterium]
SKVTFPPPYGDAEADEAALRATEWAQPAIGALSKGMLDLLAAFGLRPDAVAGHSYGELVALYAAGVYDEEALFTASRVRGEAMGAGDHDRGTMAAVSGPLDQIQRVIARVPGVVLANRNHPEQGVISGSRTAIDQAVKALEAAGLAAKPISVSAAFHSELVADAVVPYGKALGALSFAKPRIPVYACATAQPYPSDGNLARRMLSEQIAQPVDWVGIVQNLAASGVRTFVEVGPKGVLSTLVRKTLGNRTDIAVVAMDRHRHRV